MANLETLTPVRTAEQSRALSSLPRKRLPMVKLYKAIGESADPERLGRIAEGIWKVAESPEHRHWPLAIDIVSRLDPVRRKLERLAKQGQQSNVAALQPVIILNGNASVDAVTTYDVQATDTHQNRRYQNDTSCSGAEPTQPLGLVDGQGLDARADEHAQPVGGELERQVAALALQVAQLTALVAAMAARSASGPIQDAPLPSL